MFIIPVTRMEGVGDLTDLKRTAQLRRFRRNALTVC